MTCDRHLRIHHSRTRRLVNKVYLKQRLSCCLFSEALPEAVPGELPPPSAVVPRRANSTAGDQGPAADAVESESVWQVSALSHRHDVVQGPGLQRHEEAPSGRRRQARLDETQ